MDHIWEAKERDIESFRKRNNLNQRQVGDIKKIVFDSHYGEVGQPYYETDN